MSKTYFINRNFCPCCESARHNTIYSCRFLDSPIKEYLKSFYSAIDQTEFKYLKGAKYILKECKDCGMIYQKEIPNDSLTKKLYDEWIVPKEVFSQNNLNYYSADAQEIMMLE